MTWMYCESSQILTLKPIGPFPEFPDLSMLPEVYLDLKDVFSKIHATSLLPHLLYDCAIELFPRTAPPKGQLYSLGYRGRPWTNT